ncbi:MAG TPA: hypothetical protein VMN39_01520, partial [Longimicrobiaceae bacterium]|nr:hypothetical protein [Longimicrobiaceae bacterium]
MPPADGWQAPGFDDSAWSSGRGPLGFGTPGIATEIPAPRTAAYFRSTFTLTTLGEWERLEAEAQVDDGAVIYLNGLEISRVNMPEGVIDGRTSALRRIDKATGHVRVRLSGDPRDLLVVGENLLAVAVHQYGDTSRDLCFDLGLTAPLAGTVEKQVIEERSEWRYLDAAKPPASDWRAPDFDDGGWKAGPAILGYGDGDISTTLDYGNDPDHKFTTAWFRTTFTLDDETLPDLLRVRFLRDDGIIIHLNGRELLRDNMPPGFVDYRTEASNWVNDEEERRIHERTLPATQLVRGRNVVAVEIHQKGAYSSDLAFDLAMDVVHLPAGAELLAGEATATIPTDPVPTREGTPMEDDARWINVADAAAVAAARRADWALTADRLLASALEAHESRKLQEAARRYYAARWADVFSSRSARLSPELRFHLLQAALAPVSQEFFDLLSPYDDHVRVYEILDTLHAGATPIFEALPRLAMAIAVVYDQDPPRGWPHWQVDQSLLPGGLPDPMEALLFWHTAKERGRTIHSLDTLTIEELKFVVDAAAPFPELEKAQSLRVRLNRMGELYSGIQYVTERARTGIYVWPHESYT